jgi:hypothetical protein
VANAVVHVFSDDAYAATAHVEHEDASLTEDEISAVFADAVAFRRDGIAAIG